MRTPTPTPSPAIRTPVTVLPPPDTGRGRRLLRDAAVILGLFAGAYGIAYLALRPGPIVAEQHALPRVLELPAEEAERQLEELGFRPRRAEQRLHAVRGPGIVIWQDPAPGTVLAAGATVLLTTSGGVEQHLVPDVEQFPVGLARQVVEAAGLRVERVDSTVARAPRGTVLEVRPAPGTGRPAGSGVVLVTAVPELTLPLPTRP